MNKLVSLIAPCYYSEAFIKRFLDSLLSQTYPNVEIYLVNDGSKDKTEEIILSYDQKFVDKGYDLHYIYQENTGVSGAINRALPLIKGEYFTWIDADDFFPPEAIERKVAFLETHPDVSIAMCKAIVVDNDTYKKYGVLKRRTKNVNNLFWDMIDNKDSIFIPGCYMVRLADYKKAMPDTFQIFEAPTGIGQNNQMLLPIVYNGKCGLIDEYLHYYVVRGDSVSHVSLSYEQSMKRSYDEETVLSNVVKDMHISDDEKTVINKRLESRIIHRRLAICDDYSKTNEIEKYKTRLSEMGEYDRDARYHVRRVESSIFRKASKLCKLGKMISQKLTHLIDIIDTPKVVLPCE